MPNSRLSQMVAFQPLVARATPRSETEMGLVILVRGC